MSRRQSKVPGSRVPGSPLPGAGQSLRLLSKADPHPRVGLLLLLFGSGAAALIYEVVWFHLLQLAIGSSAVSMGVLLATFMGGMCAGSLAAPRSIPRSWSPLRVYAAIELAIGALGLILLVAMPRVGTLYASLGGAHLAFRIIVAAVCLLPATALMGATFPLVARCVQGRTASAAWLGWLYGANLAGAVSGSLVAGFYLLRLYDVNVATYVAVALNIGVAVAGLVLARQFSIAPGVADMTDANGADGSGRVYLLIAMSGLTALSCEVVWTRLLALAFGGTVYTFSLILAVFLAGLGCGSAMGAMLARRSVNARAALGWCQLLLCGAMFWGASILADVLPFWPVDTSVRADPWLNLQTDLIRCAIVVLPGAVLWGASFPLALASVIARGQDTGRTAARVYAANTAGAIAGSLGVSLLFFASVGSQRLEQSLIVISACAALLVNADFRIQHSVVPRRFSTLLAAFVALLLAWVVPPVPDVLIAYGRRSADVAGVEQLQYAGKILHVGEGVNAFVAVSRGANGELNYHAAGKVQASTQANDMRLQRLLAHLSHLIPSHPSNVLVIGCGAGVTAGAISIGPGVEHVTIAEIESLVPPIAASYFGDYNHHVIDNPKVTIRIDDGRHVLMTSDRQFDVITTDMIDPWVKGVATLFTREFFEAARQHLRPGGVVTQFVQLYQSNREAVKSEIGTFVEAFPNTIVWGNPTNGQGYDLVLMGTVEPVRIDVDELQARLESPAYAEVAQSLRAIGISSAVQLLSSYAASGADLAPWLRDASINRDRNLRLQYLAGLGLNIDDNGPIYREMLAYATFPAPLFTGSAASIAALRSALGK